MSDSDFHSESETRPEAPLVRTEPPRIVNLPTSFDMSEFLSETVDDQPFGSEQPASSDRPDGNRVSHGAAVLEFPAHVPETPSVPSAPAPPPVGTVALVDILENQGGMSWRESVALVHQLCLILKKQSPHLPILLDPRNILITQGGDVQLLPSQIGGDPPVMQVGRLLQTMLVGKAAPPELRLLVAQATFELPIFEAIEDVDRALVKIEKLDDSDLEEPVRYEALPQPHEDSANPRAGDSPAVRPIRPPAKPRRRGGRRPAIAAVLSSYSARIVASALIGIALTLLLINPPHYLWLAPAPSASVPQGTFGVGQPALASSATPATVPDATGSGAPGAVDRLGPIGPIGRESRRPGVSSSVAARSSTETAPANPAAPRDGTRGTSRGSDRSPAAATVVITPRESERRASELLAQGQTAQAAMVFDSLLMANPLYEPKATDVTPESMAAFRASQRLLLPVLAGRGYERARTALTAGELERASAVAKETAALLERPAANATPEQKNRLQELLDQIAMARAVAEDVIYTAADDGVVPPRPLSRQFPAATPNGVPPHRIGTLEMIIGKDGTVEFVKLHTPLNRYHERMIVSAAKAWSYRPAMRGGKPVKYRLTVQINLPENGTY